MATEEVKTNPEPAFLRTDFMDKACSVPQPLQTPRRM
jgi:hypothetical protein